MICVLALVVFSILSIFGATYRKLAIEAFDCVFRKVTLRKCTSGLDKRLKGGITGRMMKTHPRLAKITYKHFDLISWMFTILLIVSLVYSVYGGVNFYLYGNCNGPNEESFCVFDPLGNNIGVSSCSSDDNPDETKIKFYDDFNYSRLPTLSKEGTVLSKEGTVDGKLSIIEFGCFKCKYTADAASPMKEILDEFGDEVEIIFVDIPIINHSLTRNISLASFCIQEHFPQRYEDFYFWTLENQYDLETNEDLNVFFKDNLGPNKSIKISECIENKTFENLVDQNIELADKTGIYGTPTVFIGDEFLVGPRPFRVYERLIRQQLEGVQ